MKTVTINSPCRVDLSGGTLDLWPLYLYYGGLELVHMSIPRFAQTQLSHKKASDFQLEIYSHNYKKRAKYTSLKSLKLSLNKSSSQNPLRWLGRLSEHFISNNKLRGHWLLCCNSQIPPGSGLGGSSTLGVSVALAFQKFLKKKDHLSKLDLQQLICNLEAIEIEHPAGQQDYLPALFPGLLVSHFGVQKTKVEKLLKSTEKKLRSHLAIIYTGKPHHSGINNWDVFKGYHQKNLKIKKSLHAINECSKDMAAELRAGRIKNISKLINLEWEHRQKLSPKVRAKVLDQAWNFAKKNGATARKACGSGGGGCLLVFFKDPKKKIEAIKQKLPSKSWQWVEL